MTVSYLIILGAIAIFSIGVVDSEIAFAQTITQTLQTDKGTFDVKISYDKVIPEQTTTFRLDFINHQTQQTQEGVDWNIRISNTQMLTGVISLSHIPSGIAFFS